MKKMILTFLTTLLFASLSQAYMIGVLGNDKFDPTKESHVFVVGYAHGLGNQFQEAAMGKALRYKELYPNRQMTFIRIEEGEYSAQKNKSLMETVGLRVVEQNGRLLRGIELLNRLKTFKKISSLEFFTHSTAMTGSGLQDAPLEFRFHQNLPGIAGLKASFTSDAYVTINGCNAGLTLAPFLSKIWNVPVMGALTGTDFQEIYAKENVSPEFYFQNDGEFPEDYRKISKNDMFYDEARSCSKGACKRMKPTNSPYKGMWGENKGGGLGFYKFFCAAANPQNDLQMRDCYKRMAIASLGDIDTLKVDANSSLEVYKAHIRDYLCPNDRKGDRRDSCRQALVDSEKTGNDVYSSFRGNPLECNFRGCNAKYTCDYDSNGNPVQGSCTNVAPVNTTPRTQVREYNAYIAGFVALKQDLDPNYIPKAIPVEE